MLEPFKLSKMFCPVVLWVWLCVDLDWTANECALTKAVECFSATSTWICQDMLKIILLDAFKYFIISWNLIDFWVTNPLLPFFPFLRAASSALNWRNGRSTARIPSRRDCLFGWASTLEDKQGKTRRNVLVPKSGQVMISFPNFDITKCIILR